MWPKPSRALLKSERERLKKLVTFEKRAYERGFKRIAGIDEAGRGPLAGPVVAAVCIIPPDCYFPTINDSKLLTPKQRSSLFEQLTTHDRIVYAYACIEASQIDEINIYQATLLAMKGAVSQLKEKPDYLLVDGLLLTYEGISTEKIIKGDQLSQSIAAASIIAKEVRDRQMREFDRQYPEYGFAQHKGYGTPQHKEALVKYGPSPIHRKTFSPVAESYLTHEKKM